MKTPVINGFPVCKIIFLLILISLPPPSALGAGLWGTTGGRQAGLNHCSVALSDFWSIQNNQAGMALVRKFSAGVAYENKFLIPHTGAGNIAVIYPYKFGNIGLSMSYFGYSLYQEMKIGLAYARSFGPRLRIGIQLDYLQTALGNGYGSRKNFTFELGLQSDISKQLTLGIYVFNPVPVKLADYANEKIPAIFRFGLAYHFSDKLLATAEAEKNTTCQPVILRAGVEYTFKKQFFFRMGFGTSGDVLSFGFGWHKNHFQFDIGSTMHQSLGFSPQSSLVLSF